MNAQELLTAIQAMIQTGAAKITKDVNTKLKPLETQLNAVKVLMDTDMKRDMNLLLEGHATILERLPDPADVVSLEVRVSALEAAAKQHSSDIAALKKMQ